MRDNIHTLEGCNTMSDEIYISEGARIWRVDNRVFAKYAKKFNIRTRLDPMGRHMYNKADVLKHAPKFHGKRKPGFPIIKEELKPK